MKRAARALIGYMPQEEALQLLTGAELPAPRDEAAIRTWRTAVQAVEQRPEYASQDPRLTIPGPLQSLLDEFKARPDVALAMESLDWSVGFVDISRGVLSYQRVVVTEESEDRVLAASPTDLQALMDICLPAPQTTQLQVAFDASQNAFTAGSFNPNLRVGGYGVADRTFPGIEHPQRVFGFQLSFGASFVQVAAYRDRWMVRDGYHRIWGLLKKGISQIPSVIVTCKRFEDTGAGRSGFFGYELLYGRRPPLVTDFASERVSAEVRIPAVMKVVRIRAEEFAVPVDEPTRKS